MKVALDSALLERLPDLKIGAISYHNITVGETPQLLKGRIDLFYTQETLELDSQNVSDLPGVKEWREHFKAIGLDPSRYRPSHEALIRRLKKGQPIPEINSAVDMNNFFSIRHALPMGLYDTNKLVGETIEIRLGQETDSYEAINGREMNMTGKLLSADQLGAFGSPIVDSKRSSVTDQTINALHLIYFNKSVTEETALDLLEQFRSQFIQIHGGEAAINLFKN